MSTWRLTDYNGVTLYFLTDHKTNHTHWEIFFSFSVLKHNKIRPLLILPHDLMKLLMFKKAKRMKCQMDVFTQKLTMFWTYIQFDFSMKALITSIPWSLKFIFLLHKRWHANHCAHFFKMRRLHSFHASFWFPCGSIFSYIFMT